MLDWLVVQPFRVLLQRGPAWIGGWGGQNPEDICAQITGSPAHFWTHHTGECDRIITQRIDANLVVVHTAFYFWILITCINLLVRTCLFRWAIAPLMISPASNCDRIVCK